MNVAEAAKVLEISKATVYELCAAGELAHARIGVGRGVIRISQADIDAYIASRRVEAREKLPAPKKGTGLTVRHRMRELMEAKGR